MLNPKFIRLLREVSISPSSTPNTMSFWHGGRLDDAYEDSINQKKGRTEYGPGLYLTTHHGTARKYSKGSRRLYLLTVAKGNNADDITIPLEDMEKFVKENCVVAKHQIYECCLNLFLLIFS